MKILIFSLVLVFSTLLQASESSVYDFSWLDPDKEVYVLQNRKYRKDGKFYVGGVAGQTTSGAFVDANTYQMRAGYFFREEYGVEFIYAKTSSKTNDIFDNVKRSGSVTNIRKIEDYMGAMFLWSPFYAKINTFNKVVYFDWIFGVGGAKISDKNNKNDVVVSNTGASTYVSESHTGMMWGTGPRFYINEHWSARIDMTAFYYKADRQVSAAEKKSDDFSNYDLTLGINYSF